MAMTYRDLLQTLLEIPKEYLDEEIRFTLDVVNIQNAISLDIPGNKPKFWEDIS